MQRILHNDLCLQTIFARCVPDQLAEDKKEETPVFAKELLAQNVWTMWLNTVTQCYQGGQNVVIFSRRSKRSEPIRCW